MVPDKFYDQLYAKIYDELSDWIPKTLCKDGLEFSGDMIWESSSLNQILYESLFEETKDKEWSKNIANDQIYYMSGLLDSLIITYTKIVGDKIDDQKTKINVEISLNPEQSRFANKKPVDSWLPGNSS